MSYSMLLVNLAYCLSFLNFLKIACQIDVQFLLLFLQQQQVSLFSPLEIELYLPIFIINARFEPPSFRGNCHMGILCVTFSNYMARK